MADDELSAPLGQNAKKKRRRFQLPIRVPHVIAGAARAVRAGLRGLGADGRRPARRRADRGGRDRLRSAQIGTGRCRPWCRRKARAATTGRTRPRRSRHRRRRPRSRPPPPLRPPIPTPRPSPSSTARPASVRRSPIPASRDVRAPLEQRLLETSRHGAIPRIAPDGARPAEVYARAVKPAAGQEGRTADRDRDRRARRQRQRHPAGDGETARRR